MNCDPAAPVVRPGQPWRIVIGPLPPRNSCEFRTAAIAGRYAPGSENIARDRVGLRESCRLRFGGGAPRFPIGF